LYDELIVVLLFAVLVRPIVGSDLRLNNELIALARVLGNRLPETLECDEPDAGNRFAPISLLILACIIVADQTNPRVGRVSFDGELRILCEVADGGYVEAVHDYSLTVVLRDSRWFIRRVAGSLREAAGKLNSIKCRVCRERSAAPAHSLES